jgi:hypothetical protein
LRGAPALPLSPGSPQPPGERADRGTREAKPLPPLLGVAGGIGIALLRTEGSGTPPLLSFALEVSVVFSA